MAGGAVPRSIISCRQECQVWRHDFLTYSERNARVALSLEKGKGAVRPAATQGFLVLVLRSTVASGLIKGRVDSVDNSLAWILGWLMQPAS